MARGNKFKAISTRMLHDDEIDSIMNSIGTMLMANGFVPEIHTTRLLTYKMETDHKRGIYVGLFAPLKWLAPGFALPLRKPSSKLSRVVVQVHDLPIEFTVQEGSRLSIPIALAFGVSAPRPFFAKIENMLAPYAQDLDTAKARVGQFLSGTTFEKRVPEVACDHCGHVQEVTVPIQITRVEGNRGYGPAGSAQVLCSNPDCRELFEVDWDGVRVELRLDWEQKAPGAA